MGFPALQGAGAPGVPGCTHPNFTSEDLFAVHASKFFFGRFFEAFSHNLFGARRTYPGEISQPRPSLCQMELYEGATDEVPTPLALVTP